MSLFGNLGQSSAAPSATAPSATAPNATPSLFGATNTTTGASLFSKPTPAANTSTGPSLFGATSTANTTTQAGASLFGSNAPASGGSLFGGGGTGNNTGSSLFGANTASAPGTNSLFGKPATSAAAAGGNTDGSNAFSQLGNGSVFGNDILPTSKLGDAGVVDHIQDGSIASAQPAYFQALLERGNKKRQTEGAVTPFGDLPQLALGLSDISRKVRKIGYTGGPSSILSGRGDTNSYYVLAASGVDTHQALRDIEQLAGPAVSTMATPAGQTLDYGVFSGLRDGLAKHHQSNFEKMIDERIRQAHVDFDKMIDDKLHYVDWDAHRQRIHEHFGLRRAAAADKSGDGEFRETGGFGRASRRSRLGSTFKQSSFGIPGIAKSVIGAPGIKGARVSVFGDVADKVPEGIRPAPEDRIQRLKQENYADRVQELNVARIQEKAYPLLHKFAEVESASSNEDTTMLNNSYKALIEITGEDATKENIADQGVIRQRQYARAYLDEMPNPGIRKRIINGSRRFLEKLFLTQVESTVARNPREANVGGIPSSLALVKGYVRVRAARKELGPDMEVLQEVNGDYCWPVVFYMLRSGLYRETLEYLEENQAAFRQIDRSFMRYLRTFVTSEDHRLPPEMQTAINNEYSQRQRLAPEDSIDPYRMMCYKIVGRCDLNRRTLDNITNDMLDWIWLQFAMAREYNRNEELAYEAFGLEELRRSVKEIGDRYFGAGSDIANGPATYFFMQILAGMFEKAVADLYPHNYASAVHFAIALDYYGLLRVSDISNSDDLLTYTTRQEPQIAFGSMIGLYTRDFRTADATVAIDYLVLICLNDDLTGELGRAQRELCHQAITELVLETREFAQLLGDIRSDGQRIRGAVEQRLGLIGINSQQEFMRHITLVAARAAREQSRITDAALLYHLAEDYEKVMQIVNEALSLALTTELGSERMRITPLAPRKVENGIEQPMQDGQSSLSLTAVDDPVVLAKNMYSLYNGSQMYASKIRRDTWSATMVLLQLADARQALEQGRWDNAIDQVSNTGVLPTGVANRDISAIRAAANSFDSMATVVARTIGHVMIWTVLACGKQLEHLRRQEFETGHRQTAIQQCVDTASNIMVFAGLIKLQLKDSVWATLAQAGQDLGVY